MATKKKKAISSVLFRNAVPEGSTMPSLKGTIEVDRSFVTDLEMSKDDLAVYVAQVQKEGKFILPEGLELEIAYWNNTSKKGNSYLSGSVQNPYKKTELPAEEVKEKLAVLDDTPF